MTGKSFKAIAIRAQERRWAQLATLAASGGMSPLEARRIGLAVMRASSDRRYWAGLADVKQVAKAATSWWDKVA